MKHYLCKHRYDWSDECDFYGLELIDDAEREYRQEILNLIDKYGIDPYVTLYFGTNESEEYPLSKVVKIGTAIAEETYDDIKNLICDYDGTFGYVPDLYDVLEWMYDDLDVDIDYDVKKNPDKLNQDELDQICFYQQLTSLEI